MCAYPYNYGKWCRNNRMIQQICSRQVCLSLLFSLSYLLPFTMTGCCLAPWYPAPMSGLLASARRRCSFHSTSPTLLVPSFYFTFVASFTDGREGWYWRCRIWHLTSSVLWHKVILHSSLMHGCYSDAAKSCVFCYGHMSEMLRRLWALAANVSSLLEMFPRVL